MIYLYTGANGSCKTLFTLKDVRDLQVKDLRPVYYVEGRFKPLAPITEEFGWKPFRFEEWQSLPNGSILLCDEVHRDLPKRPTNAPVPSHIQMIAEHRSRGFDFFMMTQHPSNLDSFVTRIIGAPGWHRHLKRVAGGSSVTSMLQWDAVNNTCEKNGSGKSAEITMRAQPKEVYKWYDSAELHTGKLRIPKPVIYIAVAVPLVIACFYFTVHLMLKKTGAAELVPGAPGAVGPVATATREISAADYAASYRPRIAGLMYTAPVYDKLTEPKRVPVPAACVESKSSGCKCYTQDATPYPVDVSLCRQLVRNGTFFAFQPEGEKRDALARVDQPREAVRNDVQEPPGPILIGDPASGPGASTKLVAAGPESQPRRIASVRR